ncbi:MAG: hypothetical protein ACD_39C01168G0003 [uncultured bacterium]|nr:MAG: hypothetical protein ACD_39C01168G0003 [uncultured bacterium]
MSSLKHFKRTLLLLTGFVLAVQHECCGHGLAIYLSTPITPPAGMEWVRAPAMILLSLACAVTFRIVWRYSYMFATSAGAAVVMIYSMLFYLTGRFATHNSIAPGLGSPYPPMPGLSWSDVGGDFILWNGIGIAILTTLMLLAGSICASIKPTTFAAPLLILYTALITFAMPWITHFFYRNGSLIGVIGVILALILKRSRRAFLVIAGLALFLPDFFIMIFIYSLFFFPVFEFAKLPFDWPKRLEAACILLICAGAYSLTLLPYASEGALAHGWGGVYFHQYCENRLKAYAGFLKAYASVNEGFTPNAQTMEELIERLEPFSSGKFPYASYCHDVKFCPSSVPFEREPSRYSWDTSCANRPVAELDHFPVSCTYEKCRSYDNDLLLYDLQNNK